MENQHTNASFLIVYSPYQLPPYPYNLTNDNILKIWGIDYIDNECTIAEFIAIEEFPDTTLCTTFFTND